MLQSSVVCHDEITHPFWIYTHPAPVSVQPINARCRLLRMHHLGWSGGDKGPWVFFDSKAHLARATTRPHHSHPRPQDAYMDRGSKRPRWLCTITLQETWPKTVESMTEGEGAEGLKLSNILLKHCLLANEVSTAGVHHFCFITQVLCSLLSLPCTLLITLWKYLTLAES